AGRGMSISPRNRLAMALGFLVLALVAGAALPVQAGLNARLATFVGGPLRASMISFAIGTVVLVLLALVATRGLVATARAGDVPWWGWLVGAVGAGYVACVVAAAPRLGALTLFAAVLFGQGVCVELRPGDRRPVLDLSFGRPARRVDRARLERIAPPGARLGPAPRRHAGPVVAQPELGRQHRCVARNRIERESDPRTPDLVPG